VEILVQDLYDTLRELEARWENMVYTTITSAGGKESLTATDKVGITVTLLNARVKFEDRPGPGWVKCEVKGGNLVAVDTDGVTIIDELEQADFTWARNSKDVSPAQVGISNEIVEGSLTVRQVLGVLLAASGGLSDGAGAAPGPFHLRDSADAVNRITSTYDANGNRLTMVFDLAGLS
jgi:hypothetical protein